MTDGKLCHLILGWHFVRFTERDFNFDLKVFVIIFKQSITFMRFFKEKGLLSDVSTAQNNDFMMTVVHINQ